MRSNERYIYLSTFTEKLQRSKDFITLERIARLYSPANFVNELVLTRYMNLIITITWTKKENQSFHLLRLTQQSLVT